MEVGPTPKVPPTPGLDVAIEEAQAAEERWMAERTEQEVPGLEATKLQIPETEAIAPEIISPEIQIERQLIGEDIRDLLMA